MPKILCTPWLIWFLEHAARNAMLPLLSPGESTVGVVINVEHTAATPGREACSVASERWSV
ncbi:thioesterase family protein [Stieleria magnilauensis]